MFKKITLMVLIAAFLAVPAFAGNRPEFDVVGNDAESFFNDFVKDLVVANSVDRFGKQINQFSYFPFDPDTGYGEFFFNTAGLAYPDPCFPGYLSHMVDTYNEGYFIWQIVLQMKPETDIDLNIVDCVLKHNTFNVWIAAEQTGRYRAPWGQLFFVPSANPSITAQALPGPFATPGFVAPFFMDARQMPGLAIVPLVDALYTSKGLWEEGIVMKLPVTGAANASGQTEFNLKQGDMINVRIDIPGNNTVDIFYGKDNVILKYVGIVGTEFTTMSQ